jgi:2-C-methyl-D-erythritol 4-phosphate cytidylyltransferase
MGGNTGDKKKIVGAIIPAGGAGQRFGPGQAKQFMDLDGWPILAHCLSRFDQTEAVDQVVVVVPFDQLEYVRKNIIISFGFSKVAALIPGGESRQESVCNGFLAMPDDVDLVVIHDGVRPLVRVSTIENVVEAAKEFGAAISAVKVRDTLKQVDNGVIQSTLDRDFIWQAQTPQAFDRLLLAEALAKAKNDGFVGTDEATLIERLGHPIRIVPGAPENVKITMPEDLVLARCLIEYEQKGKFNACRNGV